MNDQPKSYKIAEKIQKLIEESEGTRLHATDIWQKVLKDELEALITPIKPIRILYCDDWQALYVDETKVYENHTIPLDVILDHLPIDIKSENKDEEDVTMQDFPQFFENN